ncbi:hypothetical protein NP233_g6482 [Leucocoprinus birnbaumii]|uniref:CCAAT-binding factor domain-containing protein n=1 Tax=Leucocoprinus birnbaumii TaxID=56174 RepID=A0AAD5YTM2_9AGAR|nr:hypothetical protein NP233_g6482 [Leucocoprinus birnbaumii]
MARTGSTQVTKKPEKHTSKQKQKAQESSSSVILPPSSLWHAAIPPLSSAPNLSTPTFVQINTLTEKGATLLDDDTKKFLSASSSSSEANFFTKVIHSGTLSDRLSALTLLVQSSPVHNTKALDTLQNMAGKGGGGRGESLKALRCIVDWWVGGGAPNRKLKYFRDQPLLHPEVSDEYILVWYFEDWLKKYFFSVLQTLETLSLNPLPYVRTQAISLIFTLLKDKPEQEQNLLRLLVNKLGDTSKSICSRASYHLLQLLQTHPSMKSIVVREIISLVLKPSTSTPSIAPIPSAPANKHIRFTSPEPAKTAQSKAKSKAKPEDKKPRANPHAQYYATITFNQIVLTPSPTDREVAVRLIDIYFELFRDVLGAEPEKAGGDADDEEEENTGVVEKDGEVMKDKKGRVVVKGKKGNGQMRSKEFSGAAGFIEVEDSNSKLISALLTGVNRALPFAKVELGDTKINAHLDTLFLITHKSTFNISLQALVLIHQISLTLSKPTTSTSTSGATIGKTLTDRYFRTLYDSLHDHRLGTSSKQAMYLNLLYKSIKSDPEQEGERRTALVRRFVQVLVSGGSGATEFIVGGLYLLGELFSTVPGLRSMIFSSTNSTTSTETYDPRKRDPLYAHASSSPLWELTPLLTHYHPTISLLTRQLLTAQPLTATPDLSQNTLSHFLDRFVYKNPKKKPSGVEGKGSSAMQPSASSIQGVKLLKGEVPDSVQVNTAAFWKNKKESQIPVDQMFFYSYFKRKEDLEKRSKKRPERGEDESEEENEEEGEEEGVGEDEDATEAEKDEDVDEEDSSDLEEDEIWKAMKATMPKDGDDEDLLSDSELDADEDEDGDDLPSDFAAAMASDDDDNDLVFNVEDEDQEEQDDEDEEEDEEIADEEDEDALSLVEDSDNEDLIPLDEMPDGLIAFDGSDDEAPNEEADEEWGGIATASKKRKRGAEEKAANKRKKSKRSLPTFASYEDYAKMIEEGPEDDI